MICPKFRESGTMSPTYEIGQKVKIKPVKSQSTSPRDCSIEPYAGQIGEVVNYHWINPPAGGIFYIYTVRVEAGDKEIVLHQDEIEAI